MKTHGICHLSLDLVLDCQPCLGLRTLKSNSINHSSVEMMYFHWHYPHILQALKKFFKKVCVNVTERGVLDYCSEPFLTE